MDIKFIDFSARLESWYSSRRGKYLAELEKELLASELSAVYRERLVCLSPAPVPGMCAEQSTIEQYVLAMPGQDTSADLLTTYTALPLATGSIDVVVLHHALEACSNPHQLLREVQRVVAPRGHVIIICFNPWSLHGLWSLITGRLPNSVWRQNPIGRSRVSDWLSLLGFALHSVRSSYSIPPPDFKQVWTQICRINGFLARHRFPLGGIQIYHAICEEHGMTALRRDRRGVAPRLVGLAVPRPAVSVGRSTEHSV